MRRAILIFSKFLRLEPSQKRLHLRAALLLSTTCLALHLCRSRGSIVQKFAMPRASDRRASAPSIQPKTIALAVIRTARRIPGATCLVQAITLCRMLDREGYDSVLQVGVQPPSADCLEAHAWVEYEGEIILGGDNSADQYTPLVHFHANRIRS